MAGYQSLKSCFQSRRKSRHMQPDIRPLTDGQRKHQVKPMALPDLQHWPLRNNSIPQRLVNNQRKKRSNKEVKRPSDPRIHHRQQIRRLHKQHLHLRQANPHLTIQRLLISSTMEASDPPQLTKATILRCGFVPSLQYLRDARGEQLFRYLPQVAEY